jgi:hypothetical protein
MLAACIASGAEPLSDLAQGHAGKLLKNGEVIPSATGLRKEGIHAQ